MKNLPQRSEGQESRKFEVITFWLLDYSMNFVTRTFNELPRGKPRGIKISILSSLSQPRMAESTQYSDKLRGIKPCRFRIALQVIRVIRVICEICGLKIPQVFQ